MESPGPFGSEYVVLAVHCADQECTQAKCARSSTLFMQCIAMKRTALRAGLAAWLLMRPIASAQVREWPACKKWTRKYLREAYGKQPAVVANYDMAFGDYLAYCRGSCDDMPLYLFDSGFAEKAPRLAGDYTVRSGCRAACGIWATWVPVPS